MGNYSLFPPLRVLKLRFQLLTFFSHSALGKRKCLNLFLFFFFFLYSVVIVEHGYNISQCIVLPFVVHHNEGWHGFCFSESRKTEVIFRSSGLCCFSLKKKSSGHFNLNCQGESGFGGAYRSVMSRLFLICLQ